MKHLVSLKEFTKQDLLNIIDLASDIKKQHRSGILTNYLANRTLIMLFQKTSTRTRISFEAAMTQLGGHAITLDARTSQFSFAEFCDEIRAIMRYGDLLMIRALESADVLEAASYNMIPVIDGCSEKYHPAQTIGDLLTMAEHSGGISKIRKVVWLGLENNVSNTLKLACAKLGIKIVLVSPEIDSQSIDPELNEMAESSGYVTRTLDIDSALAGADYVHTDTWLNMEFFDNGSVKEHYKKLYEERTDKFMHYQINSKMLSLFPDVKVMHCMPCHVGYEITRDAIDSPNSIIFDQAENRLHAQKGIMMWLLNRKLASSQTEKLININHF